MQTYLIRTFGCQMNKHDSERVAGLLSAQGLSPVEQAEDADVVVFMTCCVRENADERLRGQVHSLKSVKAGRPGQLIAVGGCIGQRDGETLLRQIPHIDVVFGTHNIAHLPALLDSAKSQRLPQVEILSESTDFSSDLPTEREHPWHAWVPITVGCDNFCTYCIVPHVRGRERSRPLEDIVAEVESLVADGVLEVTLLGQNVNSYGRDIYGEPRFADALRAVAAAGIARIRFATSHPKDLSEDTIRAMAEVPAVMPYLHLPVQSGSDSVLTAMNRKYTQSEYLALLERIRAAIPDLALSTDVIVGFPGETDEDFEATLEVMRAGRYDQAFTFIYSPREGTPAARMEARVTRDVSQERFDRLVAIVQASALENSTRYVGTVQPVLFESVSKRDEQMLAGRAPSNRMVHVRVPEGRSADEFTGRILDVEIDEAQTWFLIGHLTGTNS
ncbi:MAG: tRNA (N6-isopentenyl adenosine(37)-C2)-methylthiotransferase MiaB [Coriobacteriia bacterium]|nr:tRNA (N6-isopentenyl adenosine(37)-C2)-methylthiotransferase MiaB [Coriobacteriia bacterium]